MKKILIPIIGFILLTLLLTYPAVFHLSDKIIGDGGDNYQFLSFQYLANKEFTNGQFPFGWTNYWRFPAGFDFGNGYDSTLLLLTGLPLYQITSNPVVVYNLSVLLFLLADCFVSYLFFKKLSGNSWIGFIGGIIYGFSFYNLARSGGHPNLLFTGCIPFLAYAVIDIYQRKGDIRSFILFTIACILIYLTSLQYLLLVAGASFFIIPIFLLIYGDISREFIKIVLNKKKYLIVSSLSVISVFLFFNSTKVLAFFRNDLIEGGA